MNSSQPILSTFLPGDECTGEGPSGAADGQGFRIDVSRDPDIWLYRERTIALLKRYLRISIEVGRLPSLLGRELFR